MRGRYIDLPLYHHVGHVSTVPQQSYGLPMVAVLQKYVVDADYPVIRPRNRSISLKVELIIALKSKTFPNLRL